MQNIFFVIVIVSLFADVSSRIVCAAEPLKGASQEADPNRFNRLLLPKEKRTPALEYDGIHDPANRGITILQQPRNAFKPLAVGKGGNYVDWVKSLDEKKIRPIFSLRDKTETPMLLDLDIVREVKGSMPDVVYPHRQHTEWLDCSNCHPAIFIPQKGANPMSMTEIILGEKCGVCHGKVAFPITECRRCHSKPKNIKRIRQQETSSSK